MCCTSSLLILVTIFCIYAYPIYNQHQCKLFVYPTETRYEVIVGGDIAEGELIVVGWQVTEGAYMALTNLEKLMNNENPQKIELGEEISRV